ncbi:MAG TPA: GTPase [Lacipirellulaceae bacterium]|nr:GTPase [Lacipirellulaceae bacterium]
MSAPRGTSRASLLTARGRGAIAVIAAEGGAAIEAVDAHFHPANGRRLAKQAPGQIVFGHWRDGPAGEEVVLCRTGDLQVEVHCHGGLVASQRILAALQEAGCSIEPWDQWLRSHAASVLEAEADLALAAAATTRTAEILLDQRHGALQQEVTAIVAWLRDGGDPRAGAALGRLQALLERSALGVRLTRPWCVAIAGRPNVGKSSLINALVGYQRAIVYDQPGTTRDVLAAETAIDGWPVRLTDSAGLRAEPADALEAAGVEVARQQVAEADLVLWVLDASSLSHAELAAPDHAARAQITAEAPDGFRGAPLVVVNKTDLASPAPAEGVVSISALSGAGLPALLSAVVERIVPAPPARGAAVPFTPRQQDLLKGAIARLEAGDASRAEQLLEQIEGAESPLG